MFLVHYEFEFNHAIATNVLLYDRGLVDVNGMLHSAATNIILVILDMNPTGCVSVQTVLL